ncbi:MAG: Gfo/Idh/MocA family oxidoreductase [FCB group bacterium]|jgi:predicted dehydrogenase|nr:Gfo/Idh/MocA family oxidoreductase [FCB group bacterium]
MSEKHMQGEANSGMGRRDFLRAAGVAAATVAGTRAFAQAPATAAGANDRIGVGVIGCGGRGNAHLGTLRKLKEAGDDTFEIVAVSDVYRPRLNKAADEYKVKGYMDHRELLADPNVDAVCIATPDHIHGYQAIDAVRAGKHVYCEKPVTHWRQFDLTKQLNEEVKKGSVRFQLGSQGQSDPAWTQMRKLIQEGLIGQPIVAECGYFRIGDWGEAGMPIDDPNAQPGADLNWEAFLGDSPKRDFDVSRFFRWRMYEDYAGGPVTDLYPHSLTPVVYMMGAGMPSSVVASGGKFRYDQREVPDTFSVLIDYPEKFTIAVLGTQGNAYSATGGRGAGGRIPVVRGWDGTLTVMNDEVAFIPAGGSDKPEKTFPLERKESQELYWKDFFRCCKTGDETLSPMDLAFRVQTALQMGFLSFREGKTAKFDPAEQKIVL